MVDFWRVNTLVIYKLQIVFCMFSAFILRNDSTFQINENSSGRFLNADFWKTSVSLRNRTHKFFLQTVNFAKIALRRSNYEYPHYTNSQNEFMEGHRHGWSSLQSEFWFSNLKPQQNHYWKKDPLFSMPIFSRIMSSDRYFDILQFLYFNNNDDQVVGDPMFKFWGIWTNNWQSLVIPYKNLYVDISITAFKGRLFCKQYCPMKRERFGVKTFSIVDNTTGIIYSGKGHVFSYPSSAFGYGGSILMQLMEPYLKKGHHNYCDNWFTSFVLAYQLLQE